MKKKEIFGIISIGILFILIGVVWFKDVSSKEKNVTPPTTAYRTEQITQPTTTQEATTQPETENHDNETKSVLTGQWISKKIAKNRLVAVMFNNVSEACPQAGISNADIIYEIPIEGSVTRLMGIMQDYKDLDTIGSVRSCRLAFAHVAMEYDAIYLHYGQSEYAVSTLNSSNIDNLSGLEAVGNTVYYRRSDRYAPHNAYASAQGILEGAKIKGYSTKIADDYTKHFKFVGDDKTVELSNGDSATHVEPGYAVNDAYFEYSKKLGSYVRYQYGTKHIDENTGKALKCENISLQNVNHSYFSNGYSQNYYLTGSGTGKYITNGKVIDITWQKDSESDITHYYKSNGKELKLNQGKTWICIIPGGSEDSVNIW